MMLPVGSLLICQWSRGGSSDKGQGFTGDKKGPNVPLWLGLLGVAGVGWGGLNAWAQNIENTGPCCERHGGPRGGQVEFRAERFERVSSSRKAKLLPYPCSYLFPSIQSL